MQYALIFYDLPLILAPMPLRGRPLAVVGSAELLPEALRGQEPSQLLVLVEPLA